jgi:hypothetical protein
MYTIAFGMAVTERRLPDDANFKYTAASAQADRIRIANRLNTGALRAAPCQSDHTTQIRALKTRLKGMPG